MEVVAELCVTVIKELEVVAELCVAVIKELEVVTELFEVAVEFPEGKNRRASVLVSVHIFFIGETSLSAHAGEN